ncbi:peptidase [Streptomyces sp. SID14478]|uniref:peptidase n=1 Tax=Streptomyces sp. SID14478 TaxID=2706073 RepID=UPI0013D99226|nr:peptidase [Streptomyces sp. SID14478]NEB74953.1 peptidase [Streptomyces sp. SID14478]
MAVENVTGAVEDIAGEDVAVEAATAHRYPVAPGIRLKVRSGPGTQYELLRVLPLGASVPINCQKPGERVTGTYGTSNVWDNIGNGQYVADAYVKTGSDGYVAPRCT